MTSPAEMGPRVLLDESVPHDLLLHLDGFDAVTVQSLGWAGMKNGVLLVPTRVPDLLPLVPALRAALAEARCGDITHVEQPGTWVTEYTGNMGDTAVGEGRPVISRGGSGRVHPASPATRC